MEDDCLTLGSQLKAGAEKRRKQLLKKAAVVGVTCCSTTLPLMDTLAFDVCVLDECSQIVEPLSLLTLIRTKCRQNPPYCPTPCRYCVPPPPRSPLHPTTRVQSPSRCSIMSSLHRLY